MKKMKTRTKLAGAVTALVVAVACSAGTTFAWFTASKTATVSQISASVTSGESGDIMIAVGHGTNLAFSTSLSSSALTAYTTDLKLQALTWDETTDHRLEDYEGNQAVAVTSTTASSNPGSYMKIPLTIRTDEEDSVVLSANSTITGTAATTPTQINAWETLSANTYGTHSKIKAGSTIEAYAYNAARVGFTSCTLGTAETDFAGNPIAQTETTSKINVWSPNEAMYTGAEYTASNTETWNRDSLKTDNNYYRNNLAGRYYEYVNGLSKSIEQVGYSNPATMYSENTTYSVITSTTVDADTNYAYAYVYAYVWIEGTDGDCFNSILSQSIQVTMNLSTATIQGGGITSPLASGNNSVTNAGDATTPTVGTYYYTAEKAGVYTFSSTLASGWTVTISDSDSSTNDVVLNNSTSSGTITTTSAGQMFTVTVSYQPSGSEAYTTDTVTLNIGYAAN